MTAYQLIERATRLLLVTAKLKGGPLGMLVLHDDAEREYAYGSANGPG